MSDEPIASPAPGEPEPKEPKTSAPTGADERIDALDILRGFALFGVLTVNLSFWFRTTPNRYRLTPFPFPALADKIADTLLPVLFETRFLGLFSFLFGAGLAMQLERAERSRARPFRFLLRRLAVLFGLGVAHIVLLWSGDILHIYALVGALLLLPLLRRKPKTLWIVSASVLAFPALANFIARMVRLARGRSVNMIVDPAELEAVRAQIEESVRVYGQGSWLEIARLRLIDYGRFAPTIGYSAVMAFAMGLLGIRAWKSGVLQRPSEHAAKLRRAVSVGLIIGWGFSAAQLALENMILPELPLWIWKSSRGLYPAAMVVSTLAYGAAILLLLERPRARALLAHLAPVGRMALSNYLLQSVICSLIFFGFGFGLFNRVGTAAGMLIAAAIFAAQIGLSRLWLKRFQFGPVEWLWRSLTYMRAQPMRAGQTKSAAADG